MHSHLYFICPTDHIEPIINSSFGHRSYYYTSLGNSVAFDDDTIKQIEHLVLKHNIREISFVLSNTNVIFLDALGNRNFSEISGLDNFYNEVISQKEYSAGSGLKCNRKFLVLSYYLNYKIRELWHELNYPIINQVKIIGKIYDKKRNVFDEIYSDLICRDYISLN